MTKTSAKPTANASIAQAQYKAMAAVAKKAKTWNDTSPEFFDLKKLPEPAKTTSESVIANIGAFTQAPTIGTMVTSTLLTGALS